MAVCKTCTQVTIEKCDSTLCDIILPSRCVSTPALECLDAADGSKLSDVLLAIDEYLCNLDSECEEITWTDAIAQTDNDTLQYYTNCQDEVLLNGQFTVEDTSGDPFPSGSVITSLLTLPTPDAQVRIPVTLSYINGGTGGTHFGVGLLRISSVGAVVLDYDFISGSSPYGTITVYMTGASYFINN